MLMTVTQFRDHVARDLGTLIQRLQSATGRVGLEEATAWRNSFTKLANALASPGLSEMHLYFAGAGDLLLEYQLPAASGWCDVVLLGQGDTGPRAVIIELKDWQDRSDQPGPFEGVMLRQGHPVLHPSEQVRGYVEYCRRFHSTVARHSADVSGCVLFTRDYFVDRYRMPPNGALVGEYPCFTVAPDAVREQLPRYFGSRVTRPDPGFPSPRFLDLPRRPIHLSPYCDSLLCESRGRGIGRGVVSSPFRVGGPVTGEFFTDRATEVEEIHRAMRDRARLLVRGLRRQGKTSAIAQAARRFRMDGGVVLWVDLSTMARFSDLRDRLLSSVPDGFFGTFAGLKKLEPVVEVGVDPATGTHSYRFRVAARDERRLGVREQIRVLVVSIDHRAAETETPLAVVVDEIQAITTLDEEKADWFLRDLLQLAGSIGFICAGSQPSLLRAMTEDRRAAFFRFFSPGPAFDPIDKDHLARWIASRLTGAGVRCPEEVGRTIAGIGDRTQDIMQLADAAYAAGEASGRVDEATLDAAMSQVLRRESDRYLRLWNELTPNQRVVVRAIASGVTGLYAHGTGPPLAASSVHRAVEGLRKKDVLLDAPGPERLDDPFFREWVLRFAMADSVPEGLVDGD